jgi:hypothetical protein
MEEATRKKRDYQKENLICSCKGKGVLQIHSQGQNYSEPED